MVYKMEYILPRNSEAGVTVSYIVVTVSQAKVIIISISNKDHLDKVTGYTVAPSENAPFFRK